MVLGAEVMWGNGCPRVAEVDLDYPSLRAAHAPVGLVMRVGPYGGPFGAGADATRLVLDLAGKLLEEARTAGLTVTEFQVDFDCAESRLGDFRQWIMALKQQAGATPVTFTALPSWLDNRRFGLLAEAADGFVLQVHSLERPAAIDSSMTLCDAAAARVAVEKAARFGRPFRVALPTYGYLLAFDRRGRFVGLSAEGPAPNWPADVQVRALRSDPAEMTALVCAWQAARPANMQGIIWYRLPTRDDIMNWRPATLLMVISGQTPHSQLLAQARRSDPGLVEIELLNGGQASAPQEATVLVRWRGARLLAADAIGGFERIDAAADGEMRLVPSAQATLAALGPGERKTIGWLRLSDVGEVQVDVVPKNP
jgi:hypothetical protein